MKLTFDQIRPLLTGCMETEEDGTGLLLQRFTAEQRAVYRDNANFAFTALSGAGITLDFYTDSDTLLLQADGLREKVSRYLCFDALVNGTLCHHFDFTPLSDVLCSDTEPYGPVTMRFSLPKGENRVTVCMPWDVTVRLLCVEVDDGATVRPSTCSRTWVAFGDSITQGAFCSYPSMTYFLQTARQLDAKVYNFGIGGEGFREKKIVKGSYPDCDFVTIAYGTNDYAHKPREAFAEKMPALLRQAAEAFSNTPIFVILPTWRRMEGLGMAHDLGTLSDVRAAIAREAAKYENMTVLDASGWVPHLPAFYQDTGCLHPNDLGMSQYAMNLSRELEKHL